MKYLKKKSKFLKNVGFLFNGREKVLNLLRAIYPIEKKFTSNNRNDANTRKKYQIIGMKTNVSNITNRICTSKSR